MSQVARTAPSRSQSELAEVVPQLEISRAWSNSSLRDDRTIIALVLERPTTRDLARIVLACGLEKVSAVKSELDSELSPLRRAYLARLWDPVVAGIHRASIRRAS